MAGTPYLKVKNRRNGAGFTLIEAIVALATIAIILPIAMEGISLALALGSDSRRRVEAATLGRSKLDELVATGAWQTGTLSGDFDDEAPAYHWTASVQDWNNGIARQVDLEVTWTGRQRQRSIVISTLVNPHTTMTTGGL